MPQARTNGLRIEYDDRGSGEPALLFMPGWAVDRAVFDELATITSSRRRTVSLDWRGHGGSDTPPGDFGAADLVEDALAVIEESGVEQVVPVAQAHGGWIAVELLRRLPERIPKLVFLSWIVLDPPPPFVALLSAMAEQETTEQARNELFSIWLLGVDDERIQQFVRDRMGAYDPAMFRRAAREILAAYERAGSPLAALERAAEARPVLHLYAQPPQPEYLRAQRAFADAHPWFSVERVDGKSHFLMLELPEELADLIERFVRTSDAGALDVSSPASAG